MRLLKRAGSPVTPGPLLRQAVSRSRQGGAVTQDTAMTLAAVYACVKLVAGHVAGMPIDVRRPTVQNGRPVREAVPTPTVLSDPWPDITRFEWMVQVMTSLLLRGNTFLRVGAWDARSGYPSMLEPINPDRVTIVTPTKSRPRVVYKIDGDEQERGEMLHLRALVSPGALMGVSPITAHARALGQAINAESFGAEYLADSAAPSSVLMTDKELSDDEADLVQARWELQRRGNRRPAVLTGGLKWEAVSITAEESQFLATQQIGWTQACMIMGVPPHRIGFVEKTTSFGSGVEQQNLMFYVDTLRFWVELLESFFEKSLLPRGQQARLNLDALLRGDTMTRYQGHLIARQGGWRNVNEVRALEDENPIDDPAADDYSQPLNWGPLGFDPTKPPEPASQGGS